MYRTSKPLMEHENVSLWTVRSESRDFGKIIVRSPHVQGQIPNGVGRVINIGTLNKVKPTVPHYVSSFLNTYFDFGFYLGITPFRFKADPSGAYGYVLHKNRVQQVLCALKHILTLFVRITIIRQAICSDSPRVLYYFEILQSFTILTYHLAFYVLLWRSEDRVAEIIKHSVKYSLYRKHENHHGYKYCHPSVNKATILCLIASSMCILCLFMGHEVLEEVPRTGKNIIASYLQLGKFSFGLEKYASLDPEDPASIPDPSQISFSDWALIIFQFFATACHFMMDFFTSLVALLAAEDLLHATDSFSRRLFGYDVKSFKFDDILEHFEELKTYSEILNRVLGPVILAYVIDTMVYFAVHLDVVFIERDWFAKFVHLYYVVHDGSVLYYSGRICQEITKFKRWIMKAEHQELVKPPKMVVLLADLSSDPVAISGNGKFVIDNAFIGNVIFTLIILFVIVLQSKPIGNWRTED